MASILGNINADAMRTGNLTANDWNKLSQANGILGSADLRIFDRPGVTVNEIWSKARKMKREYAGKDILIIIDYLQLITGSAKHRGEQNTGNRRNKPYAQAYGSRVRHLCDCS